MNKKLNILIADDNKHFVQAFKFLLKDSIPERIEAIYEAHNGTEALNTIKELPIDLAFMDVDMPEMNGIEVTRKATEINRFLVVIAISFHSEFEILSQMISAGAINYMVKEEINKKMLHNIIEGIK